LTADINRELQACRAVGIKNPLSALDILDIGQKAELQIRDHTIYHILQFLLDAPEFALHSYQHWDDTLLCPPNPVHALPHGPEHVTLQYLLGSLNIPEVSYADNERLVDQWLHQLGIDTPEARQQLSQNKVITWVGDQLTVDRLRGLFKFRSEDVNTFDRLDWMVLAFGWLHLQMAFANSLYQQYLGTTSGKGVMHAYTLLQRKGLAGMSTRGPFHHDLEELLYHMAEAHIRLAWMTVGEVQELSQLRAKTPPELIALAERIVTDHASSAALVRMQNQPESKRDEVREQTVMWNRDALQYIVLDHAIKHGDVGLIEDFLPSLLYRFIGGRNSKYAIEVLELLQGLHREWPPAVRYMFLLSHSIAPLM